MKEIIKKIVIAVVVAAIAIGVAVKFIKGDEPAVDSTTTTAAAVAGTESGNSQTPATQGNAAATTNNSQGAQQPSSDNGSAIQGTTNSQPSSQGSAVQNPSSAVTDANGNNVQPAPQGNQGVQPDNGNAQQGVIPPVNTQQPQQYANKIDVYQQIFASGRFIMKINDPDLGPVTMAMSGNKMFIDASMEGVSLKMLYDGDTPDKNNPSMGTWYIIIDQFKKYSPMPADMIGDMNVEDITKDFANDDSNNVYTKSTETIGGETYDCESSVDSNGNTTKYYFKGDKLVRSDSISPSGEISTTEFQEISGNVDDSIFTIPDGYAKFDISWLLNMMG